MLCLLAMAPEPAWAKAEDPKGGADQCPAEEAVSSPDAFLRMLSLDLRGTTPSLSDYAAIENKTDVPETMIDQWLSEDAFAHQVVRRYNELLSNNITTVKLLSNLGILSTKKIYATDGSYAYIRYRSAQAKINRGAANTPCLNKPATIIDGVIQTEPGPNGTQLEGYVLVNPYWDKPGAAQVKVCAFDAQENAFSPTGTQCKYSIILEESIII